MAGRQKSGISRNRKSALYLDSWPGSSRSSAMLNRRFGTGHTGALQRINKSEDKMFPTDVVIVAGARTPMARYTGAFSEVSAIELAAHASREAIRRSNVDPGEFDHAIFGNVMQTSADALYGARHVGLKAGLKIETPAVTVNRLCGSGIEAIAQAAQRLLLGEANMVLAGGMENMTQAPFVVRGARTGLKLGGGVLEDSLMAGLTDTYCGLPMALTAEKLAKERGLKPIGRIVSWAVAGVDPSIMGIGPVPSSQKALKLAGLTLEQMDRVEVNEAFAAQYLAVEKVLGLNREKTNVNGGAIALGHPLGASGTRLVITILNELRRNGLRYGLATACIGGGQGIAMVVEAFS